MNPQYRKAFRNLSKMLRYEMIDPLATKEALAIQIAERAKNGKIAMVIWQMDCDCASSTHKVVVPATIVHANKVLEDVYNNAEGPVRWHIDFPNVVVNRNFRDHALEAFEDGHAHSVTY